MCFAENRETSEVLKIKRIERLDSAAIKNISVR